ncbi:hypothetical protein PsorP6_006999 [Peronosclerospora sorghi]|uniref:Uncharacterized protein n=1 Tax=Peronosclerospora sorghi TaxID=230839 RepID=A0ACC0WAM9_9STRA|nr:hypothetical protein PsorP6_006999 [Peronosclerospora sorghi]
MKKKREDQETLEMGASDSQAEALKKKLVAAVTQSARSIQDLEDVVRKRVHVVQNLATLDELDLLEKKTKVENKDTLLYTTYFQHLDALYGKVDERACDTVWRLVSVPHRQEGRQVYHGLPDSDNLIAPQFTFDFLKRMEKCSWYACIMSHDGTLKNGNLG